MSLGESLLLSKLLDEAWRPFRRRFWNALGRKTHGQKVEEEFERVKDQLEELRTEKEKLEVDRAKLHQKDEKIEEIESEIAQKESRISRFERIMRSLEREGITRREVLKKYERPLPVVLIGYTKQESPLGEKNAFVRDTLTDKFDMEWYGGHDGVIPPRQAKEAGIDDIDSFEKMMEEEVFDDEEDRFAVIKYATVVDLAGEVYWKNNIPYETNSETVVEALDMEEILENDEFLGLMSSKDKDALERVIREGDIGFFASRWVEETDLNRIHDNQAEIERRIAEQLPDLNLSNLASEQAPDVLSSVLSDYVKLPQEEVDEVAQGIQDEAEIWKKELAT